MDIEYIEDIWIFGTLVAGIVLIGAGMCLVYRKVEEAETTTARLTAMIGDIGRVVSAQTIVINDLWYTFDNIMKRIAALQNEKAKIKE